MGEGAKSLTTSSSHSASPEPRLGHSNSVTLFPVQHTASTRDVVPLSLGASWRLKVRVTAKPREGGWEEVVCEVGDSTESGTPGQPLQDNMRLVPPAEQDWEKRAECHLDSGPARKVLSAVSPSKLPTAHS